MKGRRKERTKEIKTEELKKERKKAFSIGPNNWIFQAKARTRRGHANDNSFSFSFRKLMASYLYFRFLLLVSFYFWYFLFILSSTFSSFVILLSCHLLICLSLCLFLFHSSLMEGLDHLNSGKWIGLLHYMLRLPTLLCCFQL